MPSPFDIVKTELSSLYVTSLTPIKLVKFTSIVVLFVSPFVAVNVLLSALNEILTTPSPICCLILAHKPFANSVNLAVLIVLVLYLLFYVKFCNINSISAVVAIGIDESSVLPLLKDIPLSDTSKESNFLSKTS